MVEIETQIMIAQRLGYVTGKEGSKILAEAAELGKILNGLIASIKAAA